jgi:hypothetical protein
MHKVTLKAGIILHRVVTNINLLRIQVGVIVILAQPNALDKFVAQRVEIAFNDNRRGCNFLSKQF